MNENDNRREIVLKALDSLREKVLKGTPESFYSVHSPYDDYLGNATVYELSIVIRESKPDSSVPQDPKANCRVAST
jgi:hypothetical protein